MRLEELKFHIHAPFASTVARDSIVKDNSENQRLIKGIAELCCESLYELKNNKMLNTSFFAVLPNDGDGLNDTYLPIYEQIIEEFEGENNDLIPIGDNKFSSLQNCRFTKASIKSVFNKDDLKILLNDESIQGFAINASQINNRTDRFLKSINRLTFDEDELIECLNELDNDVTDEEMQDAIHYEDNDRIEEINLKRKWLENKSNDWLQSLYALLFDFSESWSLLNSVDELTSIIKLSDGSFNFSKDSVYFSDSDQHNSEFKFVNQATYLSGKKEKQKQKSKEFLEDIGVQDLDESIHIKLLFQDYEFESEDQHIKDINRLVQFYVDEGDIDSEFNNFNFIYTSKKNIIKPNKIAIDSPFESTGLQYVLNYQNTELLNLAYQNLKNSGAFLDLIKKLGARNTLNIEKVGIYGNPKRSSLRSRQGGRQTHNGINEDWIIKDLESILVEEENRFEISKLVWNTMCNFKQKQYWGSVFEASYRCNGEYRTNKEKSLLVCVLSDIDWIPGKDGEFYNPKDIDEGSLPLDFVYNNENGWLDHIEFGLNFQFTSDDHSIAEDLIKSKTGMTGDQLGELFKGISPEKAMELMEIERDKQERQRLRDAINDNQGTGETPEIISGGNDGEVIVDEDKLQDDIAKENEGVSTDIGTSRTSVRKQNTEEVKKVKDFLYKQYKGHCQICGDTFLGIDGRHYYETSSINIGKNRDVNRKGNTLCLCPKHHAIFKLKLPKMSFKDNLPDIDLNLTKIRDRYASVYDVGRDDVINTNDGFYALPEGDDFEVDVFLLPIRIFKNDFYIKFTQEHMQNFIEVWNNN